MEKLEFNKSITFFVGENGSGKSTLLEALAVAHGESYQVTEIYNSVHVRTKTTESVCRQSGMCWLWCVRKKSALSERYR